MALLLLLCPLVFAAVAPSTDLSFEQFIVHFGKTYATPSDRLRAEQAFQENLARLPHLRANGGGAEFGITKFADMTPSVRFLVALASREEKKKKTGYYSIY